jgi:hypothetical protein
MTELRYSADLVVTAQNFAVSGWKEVLAATSREGYYAMRQVFLAAARVAIDEGRDKHSKVLWLRLVFNTWWNAAHKNAAGEEEQNNDN